MALGFSRDISAAARERAVNRPSLGCTRSRCCSRLLSVKRVSSLLPEAKQSIPRWEADVTVQQVTSHFISCCILLSHDTSLPLLFQEFVIGSNTWEEENSNNHEEKAGERIGMVKSKSNVFPYRLNNQPRHSWSNETGQRHDRDQNTQDNPTMCLLHRRGDG